MQTSANGSTAPQVPPPPPIAGFIRNPVFNTPVEIALDTIVPGQNPRKTFDDAKLAELAESFKSKGQLQPIKVRQVGTKKELVFGERRVRAARLAGWQTIMAYVVDLSDSEALEEALLENGARADVDEYEEAEAFRQLRDKHHRSAEEIAAKVGKSLATVYARLKLAELDGKARELAREKGVPASTALLAARIVGAERQREAVKRIAEGRWNEGPLSYRAAHDFITHEFMLALADAPFDVADAHLVPKAGPCTTCPKRTGNQPSLFADIKNKDVCTDAGCHKSKVDALWKIKTEGAKADGQKVLPEKVAKETFTQHGGLSYGAEYAEVDSRVRKVLEKKGEKPILARNPHTGAVVELVPRDVAQKATREARKSEPTEADKKWKEQQKREREKRKADEALDDAVVARIVATAEKKDLTDKLWRFLAAQAADGYDAQELRARRELPDVYKAPSDFKKAIAALSGPQARGLIVEYFVNKGDPDNFAEAFDVDRKKVAEELKKAEAADPCAVPGCGEPGTIKSFCASHAKKLTAPEQKSILARTKKLAAEGSVKKLPAAKPAKAKKK